VDFLDRLSSLVTARLSRREKTVEHCCDLYSFPYNLPHQRFASVSSKLDASVRLQGAVQNAVAAGLLVNRNRIDDGLIKKCDSSFEATLKYSAEMSETIGSASTRHEQCSDDIYDTIAECDTCEICLRFRSKFTKLKSNLKSSMRSLYDVSPSWSDCWFPPTPPIPHATSDYEELDLALTANCPAMNGGVGTVADVASGGCKPKRVRFSEEVDMHFVIRAEEEIKFSDGSELVQLFAICAVVMLHSGTDVSVEMLHTLVRCCSRHIDSPRMIRRVERLS
jgi:hypothetical protein